MWLHDRTMQADAARISVCPILQVILHRIGMVHRVRQTQCGVNCFILDSRRVLAPAPKVLGPKHISNSDFVPF